MLETTRLFLRPMSENDIDSIFAMRRDADIMRFIREPQTERAEAVSWVNLVSSRWKEEKIGFCAVIEKASGRFVGWCGLWRLKETGETEIGYAIVKDFWRRGYAAEAAEAFLSYGFEHLNFEKIVAVAVPENTGSRRVMEKLGMRYDYTGEFYGRSLVHYSIAREEFSASRGRGKFVADFR
jgi:ribosomal-protein-alanine N-acetyltransferase